MKSLLYKEFAVSKKTLLICLAFSVLGLLSLIRFTGSIVADYVIYSLIAATIVRSLTDDEKSGWEKYSRALPHNAFQRMGAKYIFCFLILAAASLIMLLSDTLGNMKIMDYQSKQFDYLITNFSQEILHSVLHAIPIQFFCFSIFLISFAVLLLLNSLLKGQFKVLTFIPFVPSIILCFVVNGIYSITGSGYRTYPFTESIKKPQFTAMFVASALLLFAASYFISVIIETKSGREKLKAVKAVAAVLTVAALAVSGTTVYALNKDGAFEKIDFSYSSDYEEKLEQSEAELEKQYALAREEMLKYVDEFCGETLVDKKTEYIKERISAIGFGDRFTEIDQVYSTEYPLAVAIHTYGNSEHPESPDMIKIYANVDAATIMTDDDPVELAKQIEDMFSEGLEEERMVEFMKTYGLCPDVLNENLDGEKPYKTYCFDMIIEEHIPKNYVSVSMTLNIDVMDGAIWDTRAYVIEDTKSPQTK